MLTVICSPVFPLMNMSDIVFMQKQTNKKMWIKSQTNREDHRETYDFSWKVIVSISQAHFLSRKLGKTVLGYQ